MYLRRAVCVSRGFSVFNPIPHRAPEGTTHLNLGLWGRCRRVWGTPVPTTARSPARSLLRDLSCAIPCAISPARSLLRDPLRVRTRYGDAHSSSRGRTTRDCPAVLAVHLKKYTLARRKREMLEWILIGSAMCAIAAIGGCNAWRRRKLRSVTRLRDPLHVDTPW